MKALSWLLVGIGAFAAGCSRAPEEDAVAATGALGVDRPTPLSPGKVLGIDEGTYEGEGRIADDLTVDPLLRTTRTLRGDTIEIHNEVTRVVLPIENYRATLRIVIDESNAFGEFTLVGADPGEQASGYGSCGTTTCMIDALFDGARIHELWERTPAGFRIERAVWIADSGQAEPQFYKFDLVRTRQRDVPSGR